MEPAAHGALTDWDRQVLCALAEHRVLVTPQLTSLTGLAENGAVARLRRLRQLGLIGHDRIFEGHPAANWITRRGLDSIESRLPAPRVDLKGYRHDIGVGWVWLAARNGAFGAASEVTSEREMRSHDLRADRAREPYGIAMGSFDPRGRPARHYPDLLVRTAGGRRIAVELELTAKTPRRLDTIMRGYAGDGSVDGVLYLVPNQSLMRLVGAAVARAGLGDLVRVQRTTAEVHGAPTPGLVQGRSTSTRSRQASEAAR